MSLPVDRLPAEWWGFCLVWRMLGMCHKTEVNRQKARAQG